MATQKQFSRAVAESLTKEDYEASVQDVEFVLETIADELYKFLKKGDPVPVRGIGRFRLVNRKARWGRNPQTGERLRIKASKKVRCTIAKDLRQSLNSK